MIKKKSEIIFFSFIMSELIYFNVGIEKMIIFNRGRVPIPRIFNKITYTEKEIIYQISFNPRENHFVLQF